MGGKEGGKQRVNAGKVLERDWRDSIPENVFYYRFRDGTASFYGGGGNEKIRFQAQNICDCLMFKRPVLWLVDLKTTLGKSIPFHNFKEHQVRELSKAMKHPGIKAGFIINFREIKETYFVKAADVEYYIAKAERKSFPVDWCRENGIRIDQWKLRTRYRYDVGGLLEGKECTR
jgi:penicillin-binding protein-related factor A (putative recombinase)